MNDYKFSEFNRLSKFIWNKIDYNLFKTYNYTLPLKLESFNTKLLWLQLT